MQQLISGAIQLISHCDELRTRRGEGENWTPKLGLVSVVSSCAGEYFLFGRTFRSVSYLGDVRELPNGGKKFALKREVVTQWSLALVSVRSARMLTV